MVTRSSPEVGGRLPQGADHLSLGVHLDVLDAGAAPQVGLVLAFETALAEEVAELIALGLVRLELSARDLADVPEHLDPGLGHGVRAVGLSATVETPGKSRRAPRRR